MYIYIYIYDENKPTLFLGACGNERKADVGKLTTRYRANGAEPPPPPLLLKLVAADCMKRTERIVGERCMEEKP